MDALLVQFSMLKENIKSPTKCMMSIILHDSENICFFEAKKLQAVFCDNDVLGSWNLRKKLCNNSRAGTDPSVTNGWSLNKIGVVITVKLNFWMVL